MAHTERPGDIPSVCIAPAFRQVVRFGTSRPILFTCLCLCAPQLLAASAFLCPSQLYILCNSYKLVRAPRPLCRCRPPQDSHIVQRLQVLCPAHRPRSVLLIHMFGRAPPALSQMAFCQLLSLRLPRNSPLLPFWSVASLLTLPRRPSYQSPPRLWVPLRRLFHTPLPLGTLLRNSRSGSFWLHLLRTMFSAPRVLGSSPRYLLMRLCRRLYTPSQLTIPPHNCRSRSSSSGVSSPTTL